jgi:hypothetical protein
MNYIKIAGYLIILSGIGYSYYATYNHGVNVEHANAKSIILKQTTESIAKNKAAQKALESERALFTAKLIEADNETTKLSNDVRNHSKRLRVNCKLPTVKSDSRGVDNTTAKHDTDIRQADNNRAELSEESRQDYYDLRNGIIKTESLLKLCQSALKQCSIVN